MNKIFAALLFLTLAALLPQTLRAEVNISIGFAVPEPLYFGSPPEVIVLPDTQNVYVVPESDFELFFWNGYWWRPWEGHWYRSRHYDRGWGYYENVPSFYYDVDPRWRDSYRDRDWAGHRWQYERIPYHRLQNNWKQWHSNQYWQRNRSWGVERYQPRSHRQYEEIRAERQEQYRQRPEVQRHQQQVEQQRQSRPREQQTEKRQRPPQSPRYQQQDEQQRRQPRPQEQQIEKRQRPPQEPRHPQQVEQRQRSPQRQMQQAETQNRDQQHRQAPKRTQAQTTKDPEHRKSPQEDALIQERQHPGEAHRQKVHEKQENQE